MDQVVDVARGNTPVFSQRLHGKVPCRAYWYEYNGHVFLHKKPRKTCVGGVVN